MPFRTWVYIASLGIILAGSGQAQEQTESTQGQATQQENPPDPPPFIIGVEIVEDEAEAQARQSSEREARQREVDDLAAQEGMNAATQAIKDATIDMRDYAFASTIAVWLGTVLLIVTLLLTLQANKAAMAAVSTSRGWITRTHKQYGPLKNSSVNGRYIQDGYMFTQYFRNTGQTPVSGLMIYYKYELIGNEDPLPRFSATEPENPGEPLSVSVGESISIQTALDEAETHLVFAEEVRLLIYIRLTYYDGVTKRLRETECCLRADNLHGKMVQGGVEIDALSLDPIGPQQGLN